MNLGFEVAGKLETVRTDFGQNVRKGQVLAELDRRELKLQVDRGNAAMAQALARIGLTPGQETSNPDSTPAIRQATAQLEDARSKFESARKLVGELKKDGLSAYVAPLQRDGKTLHRVRVAAATRTDADRLATRIKGRGLPATVVAPD